MPDRMICCEGLWMSFGSVVAVQDLTLKVEAGEILALIGPNGCGKTTTIRMLLGIYKPDAGTVRVFGRDPMTELAAIGPRIGVMLEQTGLFPKLTGAEYLECFAALMGVAPAERADRCRRALASVGMLEHKDKRLESHSKGMRQRVALARCLLNDPQLLILDEPFDGIDAETRRDLSHLLPELAHAAGMAILLTSHNIHELERVCTRVAIMNEGQIVRSDSLEALCGPEDGEKAVSFVLASFPVDREPELLSLFPESSWHEDRQALLVNLRGSGVTRDNATRRLLDRGFSVVGIHDEKKALEDIYFAITRKNGSL